MGAILISIIPLAGPSGELGAPWLVYVLLVLMSLFTGQLFFEEGRKGTHPFLWARPATKPFVFCAHQASCLVILGIFAIITLSVECAVGALRIPGFSVLDRVVDPGLLYEFGFCLFVFSASCFVATSAMVFSPSVTGIAFLVGVATVVVMLWQGILPPLLRRMQPLDPGESPLASLLILASTIVLPATLSLWEMSFFEVKDARNKRWIRAVTVASIFCAVLLFATVRSCQRAIRYPAVEQMSEIIVTNNKDCPVVCVVPVSAAEDNLVPLSDTSRFGNLANPRSGSKQLSPSRRITGRSFTLIPGTLLYIYISDKPLWGREIRRYNQQTREKNVLSGDASWSRKTLSRPFLSPDNDRAAYPETVRPWFGNQVRTSLWITKVERPYLSDSATLTETDDVVFRPIGWTPDGYDFILEKTTADEGASTAPKRPELWAVNWLATEKRPFLPDFWGSMITESDLAQAGEWISLVQRSDEADSRYALWLVNYRTKAKLQVALSKEVPVRCWSKSGERFAYWTREDGLTIFHVSNAPEKKAVCPHGNQVRQMKWSPSEMKLAVVVEESKSGGDGTALELLHPEDCTIQTLVADLSATENQWEWLSDAAIVYAAGNELWRVDVNGKQTLVVPLPSSPGTYK